MAKNLSGLLFVACFIGTVWAGSVPFYKDVMKNFTSEELKTLQDFITIQDGAIDESDFSAKFECGSDACNLCSSFKILGQKHEVCVKEYNRKSKPAGFVALYVDGKQIKEFVLFNKYCEHLWGKVGGCLSTYNRDPSVGRACYKIDINLLFTLMTIDFNCVKHENESIKLDTSIPHKAGNGIVDVELFGGKSPKIAVYPKDNETVGLVKQAVKELLDRLS